LESIQRTKGAAGDGHGDHGPRARNDAEVLHQAQRGDGRGVRHVRLDRLAPRAEGREYTIDLFITQGDTTMVDGRRVHVRTFSPVEDGVSLPGPLVLVAERDRLRIGITNTLDAPHGFAIDGVVSSGPIAPGETKVLEFAAPRAGTYLYQDPVDVPFNRLLGLHGALVTMPADGTSTPYAGGPAFTRQWVWVIENIDSVWCERAARRHDDARGDRRPLLPHQRPFQCRLRPRRGDHDPRPPP
jgi:FtsP/CotA-like multicopper oxidase with cupredoxin domain